MNRTPIRGTIAGIMCGRMVLFQLGRFVDLFPWIRAIDAPIEPRYNVAPTQSVAAVLNDETYVVRSLTWGLVPSWARDPAIGSRLINARIETAALKPTFKRSLAKRRCIVLADGFYEWKRHEGSKLKTPMYIQGADGRPLMMAGIWDRWTDAQGHEIRTCSVLTREPDAFMAQIHNRMPVLLREDQRELWLGPAEIDPAKLIDHLVPGDPPSLNAHAVGRGVNSVANDSPDLLEPAAPVAAVREARPARRTSGRKPAEPGLFDGL